MRAALLSLLVLAPAAAVAQQPAAPRVPPPITDQSPFRRLELPTPTAIRTGSGAPGRDYWQQRVDYVIRASLDTIARTISGEERITYTNNSPDTLRYLWLQVDQNLFNARSRGARLFDEDSRFGNAGADVSVALTRVALPALPAAPGRPAQRAGDLPYLVNGTMMRVDLPRPLAPHNRLMFDLAWSFPFGPNSNRMGMDAVDGSTVFEVAQWYPRLAVYDDVRGWNTEQYLGQGEFYLEYGSFDVSLTVPANMLVAATGVLRNSLEVLTAAQRRRLARARLSDSTTTIRGKDEIGDPSSRPGGGRGTLTWRFTADSVRDFAWAAASHFVWDAARANGGKTLAMSFYPPSADSIWNQSTQYVRFAVERYGAMWMPYPYPVAINVNGIEGGMEYPMIVFCRNRTDPIALFSVTDHEIGHTWFPMIVGSNERLYPWMDEGFNTFQNYYNWKAKYPDRANRRGNPDTYIQFALSGHEQPASTPADRTAGLSQVAYTKPGLGMRLLRERIASPERFDPAFKEYVRRWAYKHPTPADFFRSMEDGLGEDLSWFWRTWFYTTETLDQSVDSIVVATDSTGRTASRIYLASVGPMVMPAELQMTLADGSAERLNLPVEIWYGGDRYTVLVPDRRVTGVIVDPDRAYPDVDRRNNALQNGIRPPAAP